MIGRLSPNIKLIKWPNGQPSKSTRHPFQTSTNNPQNTEPVYSDSSASSSSFSSLSHRTFIQARKRTKPHNTSPQHWKRRNANENPGDVSLSNIEVKGNVTTSHESIPTTNPRTPHFLANTHQGTILEHFSKQDRPQKSS